MRHSKSAMLVLSEESGGGRISVDMEAFFAFNFEFTEELEILVDDWQDYASSWDGIRPSWPADPRRHRS